MAGAIAVLAAPAFAQSQPQMATIQQIDPNADNLAEDMRRLADNPRDLSALLSAGRHALALDDANAALGFFLRAQEAAPFDGRAKAGMGSALVQLERPADALRMFEDARRQGVAEEFMAADRGLAHDLVGDQARAQRDYAMALTRNRDDETLRRYALSLGISGRKPEALAMLDPLVRKQDRGAWRARAFVLAMAGEEAEAQKIARQTLPAGLAQMLDPYLKRLDDLGPGERAFAVHYGQLGGDAARLARQSAPTPTGPVILASTTPPPAVRAAPAGARTAARAEPTMSRAERRRAERRARATQVASANDFAVRAGRVATPRTRSVAPRTTATQPAPAVRTAATAGSRPAATPPTRVAALAPGPAVVRATPPAPTPTPATTAPAPATLAAGGPPVAASSAPSRPAAAPTQLAAAVTAPTRAFGPPASAAPTPGFSLMPGFSLAPSPARAAPSAAVPAAIAPAAIAPTAAARPVTVAASATPTPGAAVPPVTAPVPATRAERTALLASIIAGIEVPEGERAAAPIADAAAVEAVRRANAEARRKREAEAKRVADAKAAADAKKKAEAEAAAEKKAVAALAAKAKAAPERHWVQIATGGDPEALARDFARMAAKSPVLQGQQAWSARFGGTRRMLVGPFASERAAIQFMQKAKSAGVGGFNWTSPEGAQVEKLPAA